MTEYYYRYHEVLYTENKVLVLVMKFNVIKHTPKGVWIEEHFEKKRFVLKDAKKKFACETEEEALKSFRARKQRQIKILKNRLRIARAALIAEPDKFEYIELGDV